MKEKQVLKNYSAYFHHRDSIARLPVIYYNMQMRFFVERNNQIKRARTYIYSSVKLFWYMRLDGIHKIRFVESKEPTTLRKCLNVGVWPVILDGVMLGLLAGWFPFPRGTRTTTLKTKITNVLVAATTTTSTTTTTHQQQ